MDSKSIGKSRLSWIGYGAEILTVFFALTVLAGRVYAQSYWNVFGLSLELINTTFINYAIMSPNTAVASVLIAISTVLIIALLRRQSPDFVGDNKPEVVYFVGLSTFLVGFFALGIIQIVNLSTWIPGTAGLVFGLGFLSFIGGAHIWMQAGFKLESKKRPKWEIAFFQWLRNVPFVLVQIFTIILFTATSLWGILDTAQKFGVNEARMMYDTRPVVILQLDSPKGFEDLVLDSDPSGASSLKVRIIIEAGGFLYVSPGITRTPHQLHVRAIPVSRVQAIQYAVNITPLGK